MGRECIGRRLGLCADLYGAIVVWVIRRDRVVRGIWQCHGCEASRRVCVYLCGSWCRRRVCERGVGSGLDLWRVGDGGGSVAGCVAVLIAVERVYRSSVVGVGVVVVSVVWVGVCVKWGQPDWLCGLSDGVGRIQRV